MSTTRSIASGRRRALLFSGASLVAATALTAGCVHPHRPPGTHPTTRSTAPARSLDVELSDGKITFASAVTAGSTRVTATNTGTHNHEIIFIKADSAASLPTNADGSVDEEKLVPGSDIGEIEVASGSSGSKTFTFTPGRWVAVCNVVGAGHSHFAGGMYLEFTVA